MSAEGKSLKLDLRYRLSERERAGHAAFAARLATTLGAWDPDREWWLRVPAVLLSPRSVFAALRNEEQEDVDARAEPVLALTLLAGIAVALGTSTARVLYDDPLYDPLTLAIWASWRAASSPSPATSSSAARSISARAASAAQARFVGLATSSASPLRRSRSRRSCSGRSASSSSAPTSSSGAATTTAPRATSSTLRRSGSRSGQSRCCSSACASSTAGAGPGRSRALGLVVLFLAAFSYVF